MNAARAVSLAAGRLRAAGCQSPRREAEHLLCAVLGTGEQLAFIYYQF